MIVERAYTRHRAGSIEFPSGRYLAEFTDHGGTYYASPTKIVNHFLGTSLVDGGFFVPFGKNPPIQIYLVDEDNQSPYTLHAPVTGLSCHFER